VNKIQELLTTSPYILLDGAIGTVLMSGGLISGAPPEEWNLLYPDRIQAVHRSYIEAGSNIILTNSFGGTRFRLKLHNLQNRVVELNKAAAQNARVAVDTASKLVLVGGSMGPTGELLSPLGTMTFEEAEAAFAEQATGLVQGSVDLLWVETMSDLNEVKAAVSGIRSVTDLPVVATMTFDTNGHTMMGVSPLKAVEELSKLDLVALGGNCGNGPHEIETVIEAMYSANPDLPLVAKSNAGLPHWINNELSYDGTPEVMANYAVRARALGAKLIGACCGSTPAHVQAMAKALENPELVITEITGISSKTAPVNEEPEHNTSKRERRFRSRIR